MEINDYLLHATLFSIAVIYIYSRYVAAQRENASFKMYEARDKFIYLVASGVVTETDPVFTYYYKRINRILSMAPDIGIDNILQAMLNNKNRDLDKELERVKKEVDKILESKSAKKDEVKDAIENYYIGIQFMLLSHSSILKIAFIITRYLNPVTILFQFVPKNASIRGAYKVTEYAEKEVCELHGGHCA
ncbi:hypothetical protein A3197_01660 [Candidatus Thiodiazotropha endoloripes]|nr:hypothetical protein A3197_01660 [Candidatus Thiodiazotropha endoloripes]